MFRSKIFNTIEEPAKCKDICVGGFSYHPGAKVPFEKSGSIPRFSHSETVNDDCVPSHSQECIVRSFRRGKIRDYVIAHMPNVTETQRCVEV